MSEGYIVRRGGGGKLYAVIGAVYPSGSTCTCTCGSTVLKAADTSGRSMFKLPAAGTWTVKAVKGSYTSSRSVKITSEGQFESVTLSFGLIVASYSANVKPAMTTNKSWGNMKIVSTSEPYILYRAPEATSGSITMSLPAADFTGYSKLKLHATIDNAGAEGWLGFKYGDVSLLGKGNTVNLTYNNTVDISAVTGNQVISFIIDSSSWTVRSVYIYEIVLER